MVILTMRRFLLAVAAFSFLVANLSHAAPVAFSDIVDSRDNLFHADWGHWFTTAEDGALGAAGSNPARSVGISGESFNFSGFSSVGITAFGSVMAHWESWTDPDGCDASCTFKDGSFRLLPAYGLIGIWSSSASEIIPFGDWMDTASGLGLMFIGSAARLVVPDALSAYLFLAVNDGGFADNLGYFTVNFVASAAEPGTFALLLLALLGVVAFSRMNHQGRNPGIA